MKIAISSTDPEPNSTQWGRSYEAIVINHLKYVLMMESEMTFIGYKGKSIMGIDNVIPHVVNTYGSAILSCSSSC